MDYLPTFLLGGKVEGMDKMGWNGYTKGGKEKMIARKGLRHICLMLPMASYDSLSYSLPHMASV
jgi:hypothetical protein